MTTSATEAALSTIDHPAHQEPAPQEQERQRFGRLVRALSDAGVHRFHAWVAPADKAALDLYRQGLPGIRITPDNGLLHVTGVLDDPDPYRITMDDVLADLLW